MLNSETPDYQRETFSMFPELKFPKTLYQFKKPAMNDNLEKHCKDSPKFSGAQ